MVNLLHMTELEHLMGATTGRPEIVVGVIDGPAIASLPEFAGADIETLGADGGECRVPESFACQHGTFVLGMLAAQRGEGATGICRGCRFIVRPIFCEESPGARERACPETTPKRLADALVETIDAGAMIVNLSLGLATTTRAAHPGLTEAMDYAFQRGVALVVASGNHGRIGVVPLFEHPWVIPVAACDASGRLLNKSNTGASVGQRGLLAPGSNVVSLSPTGGYAALTGTSAATPFVTGAAALLWSLYPSASAAEIRAALLQAGTVRRSVVPPLLNARRSLEVFMQRNVRRHAI
jgi:subtilisin family serine protease